MRNVGLNALSDSKTSTPAVFPDIDIVPIFID